MDELLSDYLHSRADLFTLAKRHGLSLTQLLDTLDSQEAQERLRRLEQRALERARTIALQSLPLALERLTQLLETPSAPPAEARRAAATLIRELARLNPPPKRGTKTIPASPAPTSAARNAAHPCAEPPDPGLPPDPAHDRQRTRHRSSSPTTHPLPSLVLSSPREPTEPVRADNWSRR